MNRKEQYLKYKQYIELEGLDKLIDFQQNIDHKYGVFDAVGGNINIPFPPEPADLVRLHKIIRQRKCFTILEFGLGYSTIIMADALQKNKEDWEKLPEKPEIRNRFMFQLFSVDTSQEWISNLENKLSSLKFNNVHIQFSEAEVGTFNGQLCHYYKKIPNIIPDFIYLDGPMAKAVKGEVNGLSFTCDERTVMSGDLLLMEPTFLPGTFISVDGRTNNARFLSNNFKRKYNIVLDKDKNFTTFELAEERLGKYNILGSDYF